MCAINGFTFSDEELIKRMNRATAHRGPDGTGIFLDKGISLGHNRLSIIDPTAAADQPMKSEDKNTVVILNGEIYNFRELRKEIGGSFRTESDTEVLLRAWEKWRENCVKKLNGIFSFAIFDKKENLLFLARDHAGIKPLYYAEQNGKLIFSSEIKGILECGVKRALNHEALGHYFRLLYVPAPHTLFKEIQKFPSAHFAVYKDGKLHFTKYVEPSSHVENVEKKILLGETRIQIRKAVKRQLVSDRPLGVYLSGGIDSSIILHAMQSERKNVDTFSVGFDLTKEEQADKFNADFVLAKKTARHYGTKHHEVLLSSSEVIDLLERSVWHSDEPIANPTALARLKLSEMAKEHVDVVLAGDGGDELFGGYERYRLSHGADLWQSYTPAFLRILLSLNGRLRKLNTPSGALRYGLFMFQKDSVLEEVLHDAYINNASFEYFKERYFKEECEGSFTSDFLNADRHTWLVDESLTLSDKMSMAHGLEMRVPFLDPQVIEFAESVPSHHKVNSFETKILLKEAYRKQLPEYLFKQPKRGWFSPSAKWLRHKHVYEFARGVLSHQYCESTRHLFKWDGVERMLEDHYEKRRYNLTVIWALLVFQLWAKRFDVTH